MSSTVIEEATMKTFGDAEAKLAEALPGYESRPQQQLLARHIEDSIRGRNHLLAEAGTGTGKSLGYLIPAILSGKRTIISTATKALQDQIFAKDLPFLANNLGINFRYALLKGRSNYLCSNKAALVDPADCPSLSRILKAAEDPNFGGTKEDLPFEVPVADWMKVAADSDDCSALGCSKLLEGCFAAQAKMEALDATVVVVNHALFLTDLVLRNATGGDVDMLGQYNVVVFDEAHEIEDYASNALGSQFKEAGYRALITECKNYANRYASSQIQAVDEAGRELSGAVTALWLSLEEGRIRAADLLDNQNLYVEMFEALTHMKDALGGSAGLDDRHDEEAAKRLSRIRNRAYVAARRFEQFITDSFSETVRWVEIVKGGPLGAQKVLHAAPINVGTHLRPMLFEQDVTAVLASATLSVGGKFDYIAGRLGIDHFDSVDVGTPFDYEHQSMLYVPTDLPAPLAANKAMWASMAMARTMELVKASNGRALLLFTSYGQMKATWDIIADRLPFTCMKQGDSPNKVLAERFMEDTHSVLFATKSFFTGVDFQGEACSLVVIDKLPFPVPDEPITQAKCEAIESNGGSSFGGYSIPVMTLVLKQGFGRLIRHREDRGVVAILDPRLVTKGYGQQIMNSLPAAVRATELGDVEAFFADQNRTGTGEDQDTMATSDSTEQLT